MADPPASQPPVHELAFLDITEAVLLLVGWCKLSAEQLQYSYLDLFAAWAAISLVEPEDAARWYWPLLQSGMIRHGADGGQLDPDVAKILRLRSERVLDNAELLSAEQRARKFLDSLTSKQRAAWLAGNGYGAAPTTAAPDEDEDEGEAN